MKNINKKFIVAGIFFSLPILSLANLEMQDATMVKALPVDATMTKSSSVTFNLDGSHIDLKWKIEDNNVILSWGKYSGIGNVLGYKIISISPDGEQRTISVGAHETSVKDLDVKVGKNIYQLFVVGESGDLAKSAKIIIKVGSNGNHDFEDKERELKGIHASHGHHIGHFGYCHYHIPKLDFLTQDLSPEDKAKVEELKKTMEESIKSIDESIKSLRESVASHDLEEIKSKIKSLKQEYVDKINELGLSDEAKKAVETKFLVFFQPALCKKEEIKNLIQERKEQFKIVKDDFREKMKELKKDLKDTRSEMKRKMRNIKDQFHIKKDDLKAKYKEQFAKKLAGRLDNFTADKIRKVIAKVDLAIEKYKVNEKLSSSQKERFITQLNALRDLLQEKLDEIENSIDLDELLRD